MNSEISERTTANLFAVVRQVHCDQGEGADLEKLHVFARHLRRLLPADREELPREVQHAADGSGAALT